MNIFGNPATQIKDLPGTTNLRIVISDSFHKRKVKLQHKKDDWKTVCTRSFRRDIRVNPMSEMQRIARLMDLS